MQEEHKIPTYKCKTCGKRVNQKRDFENDRYFIPEGRLCDICWSYKDAEDTLEKSRKQPLCIKCEVAQSRLYSFHCHECLEEKRAAVPKKGWKT